MPHPFLTARWSNIAIITYAVPPAVLLPYLPPSPKGSESPLELDTKSLSTKPGAPQAFISLVAFEFSQTRVMGIRWPGFTRFPELNLRFYVRHQGRRGVVFIREIVPQSVIAWVAKKFYNEPYVAAPIAYECKQQHRSIGVEYRVLWPDQMIPLSPPPQHANVFAGPNASIPATEHLIRILAAKPVSRPGPDSLEHWFMHHQWGFGTARLPRSATPTPQGAVYEVIHPTWGVYPVLESTVRVDFSKLYGPDFGFLSDATPISTILAAGSEIAIFPKQSTIGVRWSERRGK